MVPGNDGNSATPASPWHTINVIVEFIEHGHSRGIPLLQPAFSDAQDVDVLLDAQFRDVQNFVV